MLNLRHSGGGGETLNESVIAVGSDADKDVDGHEMQCNAIQVLLLFGAMTNSSFINLMVIKIGGAFKYFGVLTHMS